MIVDRIRMKKVNAQSYKLILQATVNNDTPVCKLAVFYE